MIDDDGVAPLLLELRREAAREQLVEREHARGEEDHGVHRREHDDRTMTTADRVAATPAAS